MQHWALQVCACRGISSVPVMTFSGRHAASRKAADCETTGSLTDAPPETHHVIITRALERADSTTDLVTISTPQNGGGSVARERFEQGVGCRETHV